MTAPVFEWDLDGDTRADARQARREERIPAPVPPALLIGMPPAKVEMLTALNHLERLVNTMKACDPEYCALHDWEPADDQEWDERLAEAEDFIEEMRAKVGVL
jgi:hypothetical protein